MKYKTCTSAQLREFGIKIKETEEGFLVTQSKTRRPDETPVREIWKTQAAAEDAAQRLARHSIT
jgi:hypothetical protein